ncbi:M48 family metalloprotease [Amaricoccus sp.]|uniref:M48 family metalloprotease n=1 Tax=Amaricoccus sp. TaxID=1872485 RepID=UPI001B5F4E3C|nr:M48 family metalloprotease [Amaricoccus sp.]MBP7002269.1 M48 family metalloprotease [Amaricoccus sp.]
MKSPLVAALAAAVLAGCGPTYEIAQGGGAAPAPQAPLPAARRSVAAGAADYRAASIRIEREAQLMCRDAQPNAPSKYCDYQFRLVDDPRIGPNAFQTMGPDGRPVVVMTTQLVAVTDNADEIAFILGHEAGHHIANHIAKSQTQAMTGALVLGTLATLGNASPEVVNDMMNVGASLGGRAYSQSYELEADVLGAYIAARAGYDPERGSKVFARPALAAGGGMLSTHPASAQRQTTVAQTSAEIRRQQAAGQTPSPSKAAHGAWF